MGLDWLVKTPRPCVPRRQIEYTPHGQPAVADAIALKGYATLDEVGCKSSFA